MSVTAGPLPSGGRILCVGAAHVDRIGRSHVPFRLGASNPGALREEVGGACLNAARALRRIGRDVSLLSARGGDAAADTVSAELERAGIDDLSVTWLDRSTASYTALLDDTGELVAGIADMAIYDGLTPRVLRRRHLREALASAHALLVDANLPADTLASLASASAGRVPMGAVAVSPTKVVRLAGILADLDALFLSRAEAVALAGLDPGVPAMEAAHALAARGLRRAAITDGPRPLVVLDGGEIHTLEPPRVEAVRDVTGAGDTLAAVAFAGLISGLPFAEAVRLGSAASALHITTGLPERDALAACRALAEASSIPLPTDETRPA